MNESSYQLAINIFEFPEDVHLILLVPFHCVLVMPSNIVINAEFKKICVRKSIDFQKKSVHQLDSNPRPPDCSDYPLNHTVVFDGMLLELSPLLRLQSAAEHNLITTLTRGDKREVGG